jgi:hypothetical protein
MNTNNPQTKSNQKRGPTTGNAGTPSKRNAFMDAKSTSSSEKSKLATMVTDALEMRGRGMKPFINPAVEGLARNLPQGSKTNPTSNGSRLSSKYKKPITKG